MSSASSRTNTAPVGSWSSTRGARGAVVDGDELAADRHGRQRRRRHRRGRRSRRRPAGSSSSVVDVDVVTAAWHRSSWRTAAIGTAPAGAAWSTRSSTHSFARLEQGERRRPRRSPPRHRPSSSTPATAHRRRPYGVGAGGVSRSGRDVVEIVSHSDRDPLSAVAEAVEAPAVLLRRPARASIAAEQRGDVLAWRRRWAVIDEALGGDRRRHAGVDQPDHLDDPITVVDRASTRSPTWTALAGFAGRPLMRTCRPCTRSSPATAS